jgi:hypothetical protein
MSIPLVRNNTKDAINTSIIAIKKNLERINTLLGLVDSSEPDLSGFATKQELEDAVTEINNTINEVETSLQPVDTVTSGNMHSVTSNAVYASELAMRNGSRMVTRCSKVAGDYAQHWAKLFSFGIGKQWDSGVCFFEIVGHSIDKGSKISGYIGGYTQNVSDPYIWNSSNTLNNASLYYSKEVQSDGNVLITVYVPTFTDNYMWWELNLSSNKDLIIYNSPTLITDVSGLIAFITS